MRKTSVLLVIASMFVWPLSGIAYNAPSAASYLEAHNTSPWSVMALAALQENPSADHLKNLSASPAIQYEAPIIAIAAIGEDPRTFGNSDYVAALKNFYQNGQIGDAQTLNDDIFGILALRAAGLPTSDSVITGSKNHLLAEQNADGGWGFTLSSSSDTNMTAAAILALLAAGVPSSSETSGTARTYLQNAQNADGGFPYDPGSQFGTDSDSSSTAWVVWALNALGVNASSWSQGDNTPLSYLEARQNSSGYFEFQPGSSEDAFSAVTTAYAIIALTGKFLPINIFLPASSGEEFVFRIEGKNEQVCAGNTAGPTALDIVRNASAICGFSYEITEASFGPYLSRINDDEAGGLTGWLYFVDFVLPDIGAADYQLQGGDEVLWYYGEFGWPPTRITLADNTVSSQESGAVTVEYEDGGSWLPLADAQVDAGGQTFSTNAAGQATLALSTGFYEVSATKTGFVRSNRESLQVGQPSSNSVGLTATVDAGQVGGATISFVVNPNEINFGTLQKGQSASREIEIHNTGDVGVILESIVGGDALYQSNLRVGNSSWQNFQTNLDEGEGNDYDLELSIPANYSGGSGIKSGQIPFGAGAQ